MSWITRCPACGVTYGVVPDQLKLAQGWLRCGQCQQVFDSTGLVVDATPHPQHASPAQAPQSAGERVVIDDLLKQEDRSAMQHPEDAVAAFSEALSTFTTQVAANQTHTLDALRVPHELAEDLPPPLRSSRSKWAIFLVVCLSLALAVQGLWVGRHVLWVSVPAWTQPLEAACRILGCELAPPALRDGVVIESSNLQPREGGLTLTWSVRNATPRQLQMPALELTLKDAQDKAIARRVLSPSEQGAPPSLAAGEIWNGQLLLLWADGPPPWGYRLVNFYP